MLELPLVADHFVAHDEFIKTKMSLRQVKSYRYLWNMFYKVLRRLSTQAYLFYVFPDPDNYSASRDGCRKTHPNRHLDWLPNLLA